MHLEQFYVNVAMREWRKSMHVINFLLDPKSNRTKGLSPFLQRRKMNNFQCKQQAILYIVFTLPIKVNCTIQININDKRYIRSEKTVLEEA